MLYLHIPSTWTCFKLTLMWECPETTNTSTITLFEIAYFVDITQSDSKNKPISRLQSTYIWHKPFFDILLFLRELEQCITNFTRVVFPHSYIQHKTLTFHICKIKECIKRSNVVHADLFLSRIAYSLWY